MRVEGMGGQLVLAGLQRCLAYCSLGELVPQDYGSWGKNSEDLGSEVIVLSVQQK